MAGVQEVGRRTGLTLADVGRDGSSSGERKMKKESKPPNAKTRVWGTRLPTNGPPADTVT